MMRKSWLLFLTVFALPTQAISMGFLGKIWDRFCKRRSSQVHAAQYQYADSQLREVLGCYMNGVAYRFFQPLFSGASRMMTKPSYTFIFAFPSRDAAASIETANQTLEQCVTTSVGKGGIVWLDGLGKLWVVFAGDTYEEMQENAKIFWRAYSGWVAEHPALRAAVVFVKEEVCFSLKGRGESHLRGLNTFGRWISEAYCFMNQIETPSGTDIFIPKPLERSEVAARSESFNENFVACSSEEFLTIF